MLIEHNDCEWLIDAAAAIVIETGEREYERERGKQIQQLQLIEIEYSIDLNAELKVQLLKFEMEIVCPDYSM